MFLAFDPYRHTHGAQNGFRLLTHGFVHQRVGVQAAGAGPDEHGGVGHHAHHREISAEPAFEIADAHPGGDRDHQRALVLCHRGKRGGRGRQRLRFDGEHQDIGARGDGGVIGVDLGSSSCATPSRCVASGSERIRRLRSQPLLIRPPARARAMLPAPMNPTSGGWCVVAADMAQILTGACGTRNDSDGNKSRLQPGSG